MDLDNALENNAALAVRYRLITERHIYLDGFYGLTTFYF